MLPSTWHSKSNSCFHHLSRGYWNIFLNGFLPKSSPPPMPNRTIPVQRGDVAGIPEYSLLHCLQCFNLCSSKHGLWATSTGITTELVRNAGSPEVLNQNLQARFPDDLYVITMWEALVYSMRFKLSLVGPAPPSSSAPCLTFLLLSATADHPQFCKRTLLFHFHFHTCCFHCLELARAFLFCEAHPWFPQGS